MIYSSKKTALKRAKKRLRGVAMRRPYLVGVVTAVGSVIFNSAADYWMPRAWEWFEEVLYRLFT